MYQMSYINKFYCVPWFIKGRNTLLLVSFIIMAITIVWILNVSQRPGILKVCSLACGTIGKWYSIVEGN